MECFGQCNGVANVNVVNGIAPFTFLWDDSTHQTTDIAINLCAGNYSVITIDSVGCRDTSTVTVIQPPLLTISTQTFIDYCNNGCVGVAISSVSGGNGNYRYQWNDAQQQTISKATHLCKGDYIIIVADGKGCTVTDSITINYIDSLPFILATVDDDTIYQGQSTNLHANHEPGFLYQWSPSFSLNSSTNPDPLSTPLLTTDYIIQITDSNGCKVTDTVTVWVIIENCSEPEIYIPNAFTPNADQQNDVFYVRGNTMRELSISIYDRWGEKVFESDDQKKGWDGSYKGEKVTPGVFVYYIKAVCYNNKQFIKKGNITLIR